jgi:ABC-type nitrate/sulfonate/bicarbonate transport system ATPase subunit
MSVACKSLSVSYGTKAVLLDVSLDVKKGEVVCILGRSGSGKSTLLNAIAGFIPSEGVAEASGRLGFCFQQHALFYWLTVAENLAYGLSDLTMEKKHKTVASLLDRLDLGDLGGRYPEELSGGQLQRVALGRALAYRPEVLLLDEPFSSLDIFTRDRMITWLGGMLLELGTTVLMVTHYLDEALLLADRVAVLENGRIGAVTAVPFARPRQDSIRFTEDFQQLKQMLTRQLS